MDDTMKMGLITSIFETLTLEQVIDFAAETGLECLEVACWPSSGGAKRRYAGTCHIDAQALTKARADEINAYLAKKHVTISALAYYPNTLDPDLEKREAYIRHLRMLIDAAQLLGVGLVTTFLGRVPQWTVSRNLEEVKSVWPAILDYAAEKGVRIAIENCPMLFTEDEWPGGQNLMTSPANWRKVFEILPHENLGTTTTHLTLSGSKSTTLSPSTSSGIRSSTSTTRTSNSIPRSWRTWGPWLRRWNTCPPSCPAWVMWTGAGMCPR